MEAERNLMQSQDTIVAEPLYNAARGIAYLPGESAARTRALVQPAVTGRDPSTVTLLDWAITHPGPGSIARPLARMKPKEPQRREAEALLASGRLIEAEKTYADTLAANPRQIDALLGLAVLKLQHQDGFGAQPLLLRCCSIAPNYPQAWDALGLSLLLIGDHAAAESAFAEAQRIEPGILDYALHRIKAALAADTASAELTRLELACLANPLDPVAPTAKGVLLDHLGYREDAICALLTASALAPEAPRPAAILGGLLARSHRGREAEKALAHAITLDPDNAQLQNDRATVLMRLHRHAEAKEALETLIHRDGPDVTALCNLANVTVSLGQQGTAVSLARRAISIAP